MENNKVNIEVAEMCGYQMKLRFVNIWDENLTVNVSCRSCQIMLLGEDFEHQTDASVSVDDCIAYYADDDDFENLSDEELEIMVNKDAYYAIFAELDDNPKTVPIVLGFRDGKVDADAVAETKDENYLYCMAQVLVQEGTADIWTLDEFLKFPEKIDQDRMYRYIMVSEKQANKWRK